MIISKTPFRVSFFGGGTDYPDYFQQFPGGVLSTSIDQYIYVTVKKTPSITDYKYRIAYSKLEFCNDVNDIEHPVVREVIKDLGIADGLQINIFSDLPAKTGIGSSSSFTVGLLNALHTLYGKEYTKHELAEQAIRVEQVLLGERVGVQDQLAAAHGGLNQMFFSSTELKVDRVQLKPKRLQALQGNLLMYYTGLSRFASQILEEQITNTKKQSINVELKDIYNMIQEALDILQDESKSLDAFGSMLDKAWQTKKKLSSAISSGHIDMMYDLAINGGALGGKLLGAGGGGFLLLYVPEAKQGAVRAALHEFSEVNFAFEENGTSIIYRD
jgi:D-glycero-alpha-D-manno-heptose-7-phosphate kinase